MPSMADDIAIVGISFKGPQEAENEADLWNVLEGRKNLMTDWPKSRVNLDSFYDPTGNNYNKVRWKNHKTAWKCLKVLTF